VIDIIEPEEHFAVDQYDDLASTQKPILTIRQSEVKYVHSFVSKELEHLVFVPNKCFLHQAPHVPDVLRDITTQLGSLHMTDEDVASSSKAEITLTLEPRFSPMEGNEPLRSRLTVRSPRRRQGPPGPNQALRPLYHPHSTREKSHGNPHQTRHCGRRR
jgi:hypothetical protein